VTTRTPVIPAPPAPRATLAALARTAPPVARVAGDHPWAQTEDESRLEYASFTAWLTADAPRPAIPVSCTLVAKRHHWAERATAFDREQITGPAAPLAPGASPEAQIMANLTRVVQVETRKLLDQVMSNPSPVVPLKELTATVRVLQEMHEAGRSATKEAAAQDLSKLTTEELQSWLQINRKLNGNGSTTK
jgi:hypothetical protein